MNVYPVLVAVARPSYGASYWTVIVSFDTVPLFPSKVTV